MKKLIRASVASVLLAVAFGLPGEASAHSAHGKARKTRTGQAVKDDCAEQKAALRTEYDRLVALAKTELGASFEAQKKFLGKVRKEPLAKNGTVLKALELTIDELLSDRDKLLKEVAALQLKVDGEKKKYVPHTYEKPTDEQRQELSQMEYELNAKEQEAKRAREATWAVANSSRKYYSGALPSLADEFKREFCPVTIDEAANFKSDDRAMTCKKGEVYHVFTSGSWTLTSQPSVDHTSRVTFHPYKTPHLEAQSVVYLRIGGGGYFEGTVDGTEVSEDFDKSLTIRSDYPTFESYGLSEACLVPVNGSPDSAQATSERLKRSSALLPRDRSTVGSPVGRSTRTNGAR